MFTGLIQATAHVRENSGSRFIIDLPQNAWEDPVRDGESIAVNGCCLTVVSATECTSFDLSEETRRKTSLNSLTPGSLVNLERALRPTDRMGGHFVQGHVDGVGELVSRRKTESGEVFRFSARSEGEKFLIGKGSIAIDGVSLTIVEPERREFDVWIIPETLSRTNLGGMQPGTKVNVEYDVLAKYVERLIRP